MMIRRLALTVIAALVLAGCNLVVSLPQGDSIVPLEVWNRTSVPIFVTDEDARRIDVPACGHADGALMRLEPAVKVFTEDGFVAGYGTRPNGQQQYLMVVAAEGMSELSQIPPTEIPPCDGVPKVLPFE